MFPVTQYFFGVSGDMNKRRDDVPDKSVVMRDVLHSGRHETLKFQTGDGTAQFGAPIQMTQFQALSLGIMVPRGEVWVPNYIRTDFNWNSASQGISVDLWAYAPQMVLDLTTNPEGDWKVDKPVGSGTLTPHVWRWGEDYTASAGASFIGRWQRRNPDGTAADALRLYTDIWVPGTQYTFGITSDDVGTFQIGGSGLRVTLEMIRVPLGRTLLAELRKTATSDLELQRLLQSISSAGVQQAPLNFGG